MFQGSIMTLFFSLENLERESKGNYVNFYTLLYNHYIKKLPKPTAKLSLKGASFILNPEPLFNGNKNVDILYKIQYIQLAARRDYAMYKLYGAKYLDLSYYPDINIHAIATNPLLTVVNNKIYFKFEE
jgi:hypothetical protein